MALPSFKLDLSRLEDDPPPFLTSVVAVQALAVVDWMSKVDIRLGPNPLREMVEPRIELFSEFNAEAESGMPPIVAVVDVEEALLRCSKTGLRSDASFWAEIQFN